MPPRDKAQPPPTTQAPDPRRQWVYQNRNKLVRQALDGYQST